MLYLVHHMCAMCIAGPFLPWHLIGMTHAMNPHQAPRPIPNNSLLGPALAALSWIMAATAGTGCASDATSVSLDERPCPTCLDQAGGSTSDFGAVAACTMFLKKSPIDVEAAEALGFKVQSAIDLIERPVDAPLKWQAKPSEAGDPATGYDETTRVHAQLSVRSLLHVRPDPALCDGTTCRGPDTDGNAIETEQAPCMPVVTIGADLALSTEDGAIFVNFEYATTTYEHDSVARVYLDPDQDEDAPTGSISVSLTDVTGTLKVYPNISESHVGQLGITFFFADDETGGNIEVDVSPCMHCGDLNTDGTDAHEPHTYTPPNGDAYRPLSGTW